MSTDNQYVEDIWYLDAVQVKFIRLFDFTIEYVYEICCATSEICVGIIESVILFNNLLVSWRDWTYAGSSNQAHRRHFQTIDTGNSSYNSTMCTNHKLHSIPRQIIVAGTPTLSSKIHIQKLHIDCRQFAQFRAVCHVRRLHVASEKPIACT